MTRSRSTSQQATHAELTLDEQRELAELIQSGDDDARNRLVVAYLHLSKVFASDMFRRAQVLTRDELIAEGYWGLIDAASNYDGQVPFYVYARPRIVGAMLDAIRERFSYVKHYQLTADDFLFDNELCPFDSPDLIVQQRDEIGRIIAKLDIMKEEDPQRARIAQSVELAFGLSGPALTTRDIASLMGLNPRTVLRDINGFLKEYAPRNSSPQKSSASPHLLRLEKKQAPRQSRHIVRPPEGMEETDGLTERQIRIIELRRRTPLPTTPEIADELNLGVTTVKRLYSEAKALWLRHNEDAIAKNSSR